MNHVSNICDSHKYAGPQSHQRTVLVPFEFDSYPAGDLAAKPLTYAQHPFSNRQHRSIQYVNLETKFAKMAKIAPTGEVRGYPKVARLMGSYPDVAIFRRFGSLTMFNLMRLQAELLVIEDELRSIQVANNLSSDPDVYSYSTDFRKLNDSKQPDNAQRLLMDQSLQKLEQYSES